jgi:hypothetical protein
MTTKAFEVAERRLFDHFGLAAEHRSLSRA